MQSEEISTHKPDIIGRETERHTLRVNFIHCNQQGFVGIANFGANDTGLRWILEDWLLIWLLLPFVRSQPKQQPTQNRFRLVPIILTWEANTDFGFPRFPHTSRKPYDSMALIASAVSCYQALLWSSPLPHFSVSLITLAWILFSQIGVLLCVRFSFLSFSFQLSIFDISKVWKIGISGMCMRNNNIHLHQFTLSAANEGKIFTPTFILKGVHARIVQVVRSDNYGIKSILGLVFLIVSKFGASTVHALHHFERIPGSVYLRRYWSHCSLCLFHLHILDIFVVGSSLFFSNAPNCQSFHSKDARTRTTISKSIHSN